MGSSSGCWAWALSRPPGPWLWHLPFARPGAWAPLRAPPTLGGAGGAWQQRSKACRPRVGGQRARVRRGACVQRWRGARAPRPRRALQPATSQPPAVRAAPAARQRQQRPPRASAPAAGQRGVPEQRRSPGSNSAPAPAAGGCVPVRRRAASSELAAQWQRRRRRLQQQRRWRRTWACARCAARGCLWLRGMRRRSSERGPGCAHLRLGAAATQPARAGRGE